jgi:rRNA-processing protein FCF1
LALIVCDTDFLIKISNDPLAKVDLKELLENNQFVVLPSVVREIAGLERNAKPRTARRARMAHQVITESNRFKIVSTAKGASENSAREADHELMEFISEKPKERTLATLDGSLLSRFERRGLPYITLSKGKLFFGASQRATYLTKRTR